MAPEAGSRELPQRVLVTGASGFLGSHLVRALLASGVKVRALLLPGDLALSLEDLDGEVERFEGDVGDRAGLVAAMDGCGVVFHLAAIDALWLPEPKRLYEVNVEGTVNVMEAARQAGVGRVVHASSVATVGYTVGRGLSDESTGFNLWDVANDHVLSTYMAELEALGFASRGLDVVAVNPGFPLGQDDRGPTPTGKLVADMLAGTLPFVVDGGINVVAASDVAAGLIAAARRGVAGQRYILGGHNVTFKQLGQELGRLTGQRAPRLELPTTVAKAWGWANAQWSEKLSKKAPEATLNTVSHTAGRYMWFSSDKAERDLGYTRSPLAQALQASVDWFRKYPV